MGVEELFGEAIKKQMYRATDAAVVIGKAVNISAQKCDVEVEGEPTLLDVKFCLLEESLATKIVVRPKENSDVAVLKMNKEEALLIQCSDIEEVLMITGDKCIKVNEAGLLLASETDTLKQVLTLIISAVKKVMVMQGKNPDYEALDTALQKTNKIFA